MLLKRDRKARPGWHVRHAILATILVGATSSWASAEPVGQPIVYKQARNRALRLYVVKPRDWKATDARPAIVFFHGGGWVGGSPDQFDEQAKYFASLGLVCIQVEYRLLDRNAQDPPLVCIQDARTAMRWVRSHGKELGVDPGRIAAAGGSAGGHLAAFVGMAEGLDDPGDDRSISPRANALVLFNPVLDNGPDGGYGFERVRNRFKEFSPAHQISRDDPPTIVFLGTQDKLIPVAVMKRFQANMKKAGVRCEVSYAPGQGHGFFNTEPWRTRAMHDAERFLRSLNWLPAESTPSDQPTAKAAASERFAKGSQWVGRWTFQDKGYAGMTVQYQFKVTERKGERFQATGDFPMSGRVMKTTIEGVVRGNRVEYVERGEGSYRFNVRGTLQKDTLSLQFQGTGIGGNARFGTGELVVR